ncbi:MAG: competence protein ComEC [Candidatus Berkelbacteria bacterium Licking1014_7]|uniref:Competence protein ComEC n=1 Tax=Candidatus Berkelbacteria bacterium Licking1014_7 TaxID=2017147 RepID=A0A554LIL0_9BACT|nr:MAG: competence protein ComEC [Candidatus Berkelbacteria bacterium Licking1014_7]
MPIINYTLFVNNYQILFGVSVAFLTGIGLSEFWLVDSQIVFWIFLLSLSIALIFFQEKWVFCWGLIVSAFFAGLGYSDWLGREKLIVVSEHFWLFEILKIIRVKFENILSLLLPYPHSLLATGLLVGIDANFPKDLKQAFITTGTIHIVAISGFNITIVIKIFSDWVRGLGRRVAFLSGILMVLGFVVLVGGQASVVRAGIMGGLFLAARFLFRQTYMINALLASAALMVLQEPAILIKDIGFQLSFSAMLGLVYISPILRWGIEQARINKILPKFLGDVLVETIAAQIAVAPIIIFYFERISLLSPIPNLLILPLIIVPMALSALAGLSGFIWLGLGKIFAYPLFWFLNYFIGTARFFSNVPGMQKGVVMTFWQTAGVYGIIVAIVFLADKLKLKIKS